MIWFSADQHFGHTNIIKYCNRPFKDSNHMDNIIINNYNSLVDEDDEVYMLGDFSMTSDKKIYGKYVKRLKGRKHLILGNHDRLKNPWNYINIGFTSVHAPYLELNEFALVHDPALSQVDTNRKFLVGHVHNLFKKQKNCYNVGVDIHNFYPISINYIMEDFND